MTTRVPFAVLVLLGLTAFAPAPFPRAARAPRGNGLSLEGLQGQWSVVKVQTTRSRGPHTDSGTSLDHVRIAGDRWSFVYGRQARSNDVHYTIRVDARAQPPQLDFFHVGAKDAKPYGQAILKRQGDVVQIMYTWGGARAASFEAPPDGHWLITLKRAR
jgi:uncharacterized protein (TIGR03067 family)